MARAGMVPPLPDCRMCRSLAAFLLAAAVMMAVAQAHEGHDHGAPPPPVSTTIAPRVDASSDAFELVGVLRNGKLTLFLDRFVTNEPVTDAAIEIETPSGTRKATLSPDGAFVIDADWARPGETHDLIVTVMAGTEIDVLTGQLTVPAADGAAPVVRSSWLVASAVATGLRDRVSGADPTLPAVGIGAFLLGLLVARRRRRPSAAAGWLALGAAAAWLAAPQPTAAQPAPASGQSAVDLAQRFPDGAVFVPKPTQRILGVRTLMARPAKHRRAVSLPGRVIPDPSASGAVQTSVTGRLSPPPGGFPRLGQRVKAGDVLALVQPSISAADVTAQQQQLREIEQQITLVERRLERLRPLGNVVARAQIEDSELELSGLRGRQANLQRAQQREPERLSAPVDGLIAAAAATPGQVVEVNAMIFQLVDPERLWVEALTFDALAGAKSGTARLNDGRSLRLDYQGTGFADRNQAIPIHFAVSEGARGLRLGQLLTVLAETEETRTGIALPRTAVVRAGNGQMIVYEHTAAERFVPREVRVEALDGERVLVVSGFGEGRRVVTQGVELINQIR